MYLSRIEEFWKEERMFHRICFPVKSHKFFLFSSFKWNVNENLIIQVKGKLIFIHLHLQKREHVRLNSVYNQISAFICIWSL